MFYWGFWHDVCSRKGLANVRLLIQSVYQRKKLTDNKEGKEDGSSTTSWLKMSINITFTQIFVDILEKKRNISSQDSHEYNFFSPLLFWHFHHPQELCMCLAVQLQNCKSNWKETLASAWTPTHQFPAPSCHCFDTGPFSALSPAVSPDTVDKAEPPGLLSRMLTNKMALNWIREIMSRELFNRESTPQCTTENELSWV